MRIPGRIFLAILFAAALLGPRAAQAKKPAPNGWAEFMSKATAYLRRQQDAAKREFALESWKRYDLDPKTDTFTFSTKGKPGVVAHAVTVGSTALILSAKGAYRAPYGGGALYIIFTDIHRVK